MDVSDLARFMAREAYREKEFIDRISSESDPEEVLVTGDVLGPLRATSSEGRYTILRGENISYSRFRPGERVDIAEIHSKTKKFRALKATGISSIRYPKPGSIELLIPKESFLVDTNVEVFLLPKTFSSLKWKLRKKLKDIDEAGWVAPHNSLDLKSLHLNFKQSCEHLNPVQSEAIRNLIISDLHGVVQGPPGTGKTHVLVDLIKVALKSNVRVGLASLTHAAIDNALARVIKSGVNPDKVVRVATQKKSIKTEPYGNFDVDKISGGSFGKILTKSGFDCGDHPKLYAATLHSWCLSKETPEIDVLIVDEASQVPIYFYPFLSVLSSRFILFGDHKQLPPVLQASPYYLPAEDIFSYELEKYECSMLETQYRMNQSIQDWSSKRFYDSKLNPADKVRNRDILRGNRLEFSDKEVNLLLHKGRSSNNANKIEASMISDLVYDLNSNGSLPLKEVGIVTPHRSQAGLISASLQEKFGVEKAQEILVDTVERFQGQEREAMLFSMGVERDLSRKGDHGFLGDGRRLNVAVTRARSRFYCLTPEKLIGNTKMQKNAENLNSFFDWCGNSISNSNNSETA